MGRPSKLTPELQEQLCAAIEAGAHPETACNLVKICIPTYYNWLAEGRKESREDYTEFALAVDAAKARCTQRKLQTIENAAASGTWQAAAWYLERTQPDKYALKRDINIHLSHEPLQVEVKTVEPNADRIASILSVLATVGVVPTEGEIKAAGTNYHA